MRRDLQHAELDKAVASDPEAWDSCRGRRSGSAVADGPDRVSRNSPFDRGVPKEAARRLANLHMIDDLPSSRRWAGGAYRQTSWSL